MATALGRDLGRVEHDRSDPPPDHPVHRLRAICLALPGVAEKVSHGEPTWFAGRVFVQSSDRHHDDRVGF